MCGPTESSSLDHVSTSHRRGPFTPPGPDDDERDERSGGGDAHEERPPRGAAPAVVRAEHVVAGREPAKSVAHAAARACRRRQVHLVPAARDTTAVAVGVVAVAYCDERRR
jgi:hypothetical protein